MPDRRRLLLPLVSALVACSAPTGKPPVSPPIAAAASHNPGSEDPDTSSMRPSARMALQSGHIDPRRIRCNSRVLYGNALWQYSQRATEEISELWPEPPDAAGRKQAARILLGYFVRSQFEATRADNFGAMTLAIPGNSDPLVIFRSRTMPEVLDEESCLGDLLEHGNLRHVVNLYGGEFPLFDWIEAEERLLHAAGGTYYNAKTQAPAGEESFRDLIKNPETYETHRAQAAEQVAALIRTEILTPARSPGRGNILVHCGGGMHRTGMVIGILQKCLNRVPMDAIEEEYRYHTAYQGPETPNGFEPLNLRFIREFECDRIDAP